MSRVLVAGGSRRQTDSTQHSEEYRRYIASPVWQERRRYILARDNHTCRRCGDPATDVHHLTYERLGNEDKEDLLSLCGPCHVKADRDREQETFRRQWDARLEGWASKVYGEHWGIDYDHIEIEEEFERWLGES